MTRYYGNKRGLVVMNDDAYISDNDKRKAKIVKLRREITYEARVNPQE